MSGECKCGKRHDADYSTNGHRELEEIYDYHYLDGEISHQVLRYKIQTAEGPDKTFSQRRPDGSGGYIWSVKGRELPLYRLPKVTDAIRGGEIIYICEGEKDANNGVEHLGLCTTTNTGGAEKWADNHTHALHRANVVLLPHNDSKGEDHVLKVANALVSVAKSVKVVKLPGVPEDGGDLSDWIEAGGTGEELDALISSAPLFKSSNTMGSEFDLNKCLPTYTVGELKEITGGDTEAGWICPMFMRAGEITLLAGASKRSGKTTLIMHMLKAIQAGEEFMGMGTVPTGALVLTEQGNNILEATTKAGIKDDDRILITPYKDVSTLKWDDLIARARVTCGERTLGLLVIDTLTAFSKLRGNEENLSGEIIQRMEAVLEAARVDGLHVTVIHHTGKDGEIRGSSAFEKDPDVIWILKRPPGAQHPNIRTLEGTGRYDSVNTSLNVALEADGYKQVGSSAKIEYEKAKAGLLEEITEGEENGNRRTEVMAKLEEFVSKSTLQRALEDLIDRRAVREKKLKAPGSPHVLWRPKRGIVVDDQSFKSSSQVGDLNAEAAKQDTYAENDLFKSNSDPGETDDLNKEEGGFPEPELITTKGALAAMVETLSTTEGPFAFDVETYPRDETASSLDPRRGKVGVISLSSSDNTFVIDRKAFSAEDVLSALKQDLPGRSLIAHNAPFDLAFLRRDVGYEHRGPVYDTLVLDAMYFYATGPLAEKESWRGFTKQDKELGYKKSLTTVAEKFLGVALDKEEQLSDWGGELSQEMVSYAALDTAILLPLKDALLAELENLGMGRVVEIESRFTPAMAYCSDNGFAFDVEGWKKHAAAAESALKAAKEKCARLAPEPPEDMEWAWNASNHRKVGLALEMLGAKVEKNPSTDNYKTDEAALKAIKRPKKAKELAETILELRAHEKYVTTYGASWFRAPEVAKQGKTKGKIKQGSPGHMMVVEGRVHTQHNQLVATGRGSSKSPNLQNIPGGLHEYFIAPPGRKLITADYEQMEYRAVAFLAEDEDLLTPIREGVDYHSITAGVIGTDRSTAKTVNFALLYGQGSKALAEKLGVSKTKAEEYIRKLFANAPALAKWRVDRMLEAKSGVPYSKTPSGRIRLLDQYYNKYSNAWSSSATQALNHPIQGGCADGYKMAGALFWERSPELPGNPLLVNVVHDELVVEVDEGVAEEVEKAVVAVMIEGMKFALGEGMPVSVETKIADKWEKE
jgi:DNA polymerase I-like protein with 3'-5' exonuclease and polymerase domains